MESKKRKKDKAIFFPPRRSFFDVVEGGIVDFLSLGRGKRTSRFLSFSLAQFPHGAAASWRGPCGVRWRSMRRLRRTGGDGKRNGFSQRRRWRPRRSWRRRHCRRPPRQKRKSSLGLCLCCLRRRRSSLPRLLGRLCRLGGLQGAAPEEPATGSECLCCFVFCDVGGSADKRDGWINHLSKPKKRGEGEKKTRKTSFHAH